MTIVLVRSQGRTTRAYRVRDLTEGDEEFTKFAIHSNFPRLIPESEIWIEGNRVRGGGIDAHALSVCVQRSGIAHPETNALLITN